MPASTVNFTTEDKLHVEESKEIASFWESREQEQFVGRSGLGLRWCAFTKAEHTKAIVLVNGRTETIIKYKEVFFDLFKQGYDVYSYDHRGQGLSQRLVVASDIGHVVEFEHYVDDLETFIEEIVIQKIYQQRFLLGHSMGGAIALLYAKRKHNHADALALSAPMLGIALSPALEKVAPLLCRFLSHFQHPAQYGPGQKPYSSQSFENNTLTHSRGRYEKIQNIYEREDRVKVGGPSSQWIWQSMQACDRALDSADKIKIPIMLLQASKDQIVDNEKMFKFYKKRRECNLPIQFDILANASHELLFEKDDIRNKTLNLIIDFFNKLR